MKRSRIIHTRSSGSSMIATEKFTYDWTLQNTEAFSKIFRGSCSMGSTLNINSGVFKAGNKVGKPCKWYLIFGVNFRRDGQQYISLHLCLKKILWERDENEETHCVQAAFRLQILNKLGKVADSGQTGLVHFGFGNENFRSTEVTTCWGWDDYCTYEELVEMHDSAILSHEKLVFRVEMDIFGATETIKRRKLTCGPLLENNLMHTSSNLVETYSELLKTGRDSDVTIITKNKTYAVHKLILSVASPVFSTMLEIDMKEKESNTIDLSTMDSETVDIMLNYIYTRNVTSELESNNLESIFNVMSAAHMYQLEGLKDECFQCILPLMTIQNAAKIALWTYLYNPKHEIFEEIQDFYLRNIKGIRATKSFKILFQQNPSPFDSLIFETTDRKS